jgi:O-antigen/teichoic acid export membrane protein
VQARGGGGLARLHRHASRIYAFLGVAVVAVMLAAAWPLAAWWLPPQALPTAAVAICLALIGVRIGLSLPWSIHQAALVALGRQEAYNTILVCTLSLGAVGGLLAVLQTGSLIAYCAVQLACSAFGVWALRYEASRALAALADDGPPQPLSGLLREALPLIGINGSGILTSILDRLLVSRLPTASLGIYNAAGAPARVLNQLLTALYAAILPRTCRIAAIGDAVQLDVHLRRTLAVAGTLTAAIGVTGICFARDFLHAWTGHNELAAAGAPVMACTVLGSCAGLIGGAHFHVQIALGRELAQLRSNLALLPCYAGALLWAVMRGDMVLAAGASALVGIASGLVTVIHVHARCLTGWRSGLAVLRLLFWRHALALILAQIALVLADQWATGPWLRIACGAAAGTLTLLLGGVSVLRVERRR